MDLVVTPADGPIYAFVAGEVLHAKMGVSGSGFGNYGVRVAIKDEKGYLHVYAHLSDAGVKVGQQVKRGQLIGKQGSSGISSEAHLHYAVRKSWTPQFGYTATEAGVAEPTQYLINYYGQTPVKEDKAVSQEHDINVVSPWAEASWTEAQANGYFDGTRPGAPITREETAIVMNLLRKNLLKLIAEINGNVADLYDLFCNKSKKSR
ncbi:M23 family metallopeptidase [Paenibacillus pabuli]|uniref:M23 family metallopeptidase n=1 Tax=Paenibacillus pabuli TaxID=1472 RepID=UPI0007831897|nr:M23 family metallopeptidase [Paenibacillus pabuli]MEC0126683.1 M23 family metallopeptidase [Paenibacillus pabuli]